MKKVAVILGTLPKMGGEYQYELLIAEILRECAPGNYKLVALCLNSFWMNWCRKHDVPCLYQKWFSQKQNECSANIRHPFLSGIYHRYFTEPGKKIRKEKISLLICGQQGLFVPNYLVKEMRPVHDLMHRYERRFEEIGNNFEERELLFCNVARNVDVIFTDSRLGKRQFRESYRKYIKKKQRIVVLPYVVSQNVMRGAEECIDVPEKYVFYPAQFWEHKNHINLVKAVALVRRRIPDIHLVLAGADKNALQKIKNYISDEHLEKNVSIKGFVSDENIIYLYRHAQGLIMPTYFGPTNIPPLEAMALGCPVAVSDRYAMPEQAGKAGIYFNPDAPEEIADCIYRLWTDEALRRRMIKEGYRKIEKWTRRDFKKKFIQSVMGGLQKGK